MILVDTGPLVALCDPGDRLHRRATAELRSLGRDVRAVSLPVVVEAHFLLRADHLRRRLVEFIEQGVVDPVEPDDAARCLRDTLEWLQVYSEHEPDFADGWLVALAAQTRASIWTFDSEFETTWRLLDGSVVPRSPRRPKHRRP